MITNQRFRDPDVNTGVPKDDVYRNVRITFSAPDKSGASPRGVRLWPGDDTPRQFIGCKLINCEPPPGSTLQDCTAVVMDYRVLDRGDTLTVNGSVLFTDEFYKNIAYGIYDSSANYVELPVPEESVPKRIDS